MSDFFKYSNVKRNITLLLIFYILAGLIFLSSYNCSSRCLDNNPLTVLDNISISFANPALWFSKPFVYFFNNIIPFQNLLDLPFFAQLSLLVVAVLIEILFLYFIACILVFLARYFRRES